MNKIFELIENRFDELFKERFAVPASGIDEVIVNGYKAPIKLVNDDNINDIKLNQKELLQIVQIVMNENAKIDYNVGHPSEFGNAIKLLNKFCMYFADNVVFHTFPNSAKLTTKIEDSVWDEFQENYEYMKKQHLFFLIFNQMKLDARCEN